MPKVKMTKVTPGSEDGFTTNLYLKDQEYDLNDTLAKAFVEDMVEPGSCYLKMLRSPHAHAYIKSIDTSEAEKIPGVVYILTHKNCPDIY